MIFINSSRVAMKKILLCLLLGFQVNQNLYSFFGIERNERGTLDFVEALKVYGIVNAIYTFGFFLFYYEVNQLNNKWSLFTNDPSTLEQADFIEKMKELEEQHGKNFRKLLRADVKRVNEISYQFEGREIKDPGNFLYDLATDNNYRIWFSYYFKLHWLYIPLPALLWKCFSIIKKLHALKDRLELIEEIAFPQI